MASVVLPGIEPGGELQADSFAPFGSFQHRPQPSIHCDQRPAFRDPSFNGSASAPICEDHIRARLWRFLASRSRFPGFVVRRNVKGCYLICLLVNRISFQICQHHRNHSSYQLLVTRYPLAGASGLFDFVSARHLTPRIRCPRIDVSQFNLVC